MSVMILGSDHIDYLVSAAALARVVRPGGEQALGVVLLSSNADAYLGPDWEKSDVPEYMIDDDVDDDAPDDRAALLNWRETYRWRPVAAEDINPQQTAQAVESWMYQVTSLEDHGSCPGWQEMERLKAAVGPQEPDESTSWVWSRSNG